MKKRYFIYYILFFCSIQTLLSQQFITPDQDFTNKLNLGVINPYEFFNVSKKGEEITIAPTIPDNWSWFIVEDMEIDEEKYSFFFIDGRIYTDKGFLTNHRRIKYQKNISEQISSECFNIGFFSDKGKEKYSVILLYDQNSKSGVIKIDKSVWGEEKIIEYNLIGGEPKLLIIQKNPPESKPFYFEEKTAKRDTINLNNKWIFKKGFDETILTKDLNESEWATVNIPHCWNTDDMFDHRNTNDGYNIVERYYRGKATYIKTFSFDESKKLEKVFLEFEAAFQVAKVWLNNNYLGEHIGGYTGFKFDVTNNLKKSNENKLIVMVDNSYNFNIPPHSADYYMYGGLYRDVRLIFTENIYFKDDIKITTSEVSNHIANAQISVSIANSSSNSNDLQIVSNIIDDQNEIVSTVKIDKNVNTSDELTLNIIHKEISNPKLWSPENPNLYRVINTIYVNGNAVDKIEILIGFRWFDFDPDSGFSLNGEKLFLKGVNKHQDYFKYGIAVPDSIQINDIKLLKDMGANFIRLAHYPQDPSVLDACDKLGILVWEEIPVVNSVGGKQFSENAKNMLKEMINRDFNHPSIIMWGLTNESVMGFADDEAYNRAYSLIGELNKTAKDLDSTRPTVQAHNDMANTSIADITDIIGRNRYYGWYEMPITQFKDELEREKKEHPNWITIISEYGVGSKLGYHVENPERFDFSENYQLEFHEYYWKTISETPWLAGSLIWASIDFGSPTKFGNITGINQKGIFDFSRNPKDLYYFYKSQWTEDLMLYIVSKTQNTRHGKIGELKEIKVYSNGNSVELFLNGDSMGIKDNQYIYTWNVKLNEGKNELIAIADNGIEKIREKKKLQYIIE